MPSTITLPVSAIIATLDRPAVLRRTLQSLATSDSVPAELIVIDASSDTQTEEMLKNWVAESRIEFVYQKAITVGAAAQRNQGVPLARNPLIWFLDDDILLEPDCLARLCRAINDDSSLGGVNAMIVNQRYMTPGLVSRSLFRILSEKAESTYAGKCLGPAVNLLPEDSDDLPESVPVEWLNTTCTLYRKTALNSPPFDDHFTGYSLLEDLALSLTVGKHWNLANVRKARIVHDSQPGEHKDGQSARAEMELVNRHYVMSRILNRTSFSDYMKLFLFEAFGVVTPLASRSNWKSLPFVLMGKARGVRSILGGNTRNNTVSQASERLMVR